MVEPIGYDIKDPNTYGYYCIKCGNKVSDPTFNKPCSKCGYPNKVEEINRKFAEEKGITEKDLCPCGDSNSRADCEVCQDLPIGTLDYWEKLRKYNKKGSD